ncbi:PF07377 family protein [Leptospira kirschneri str. 200802841]|uniref:PF07377 family protein n=2 Tax=Leptospira kirschneri TaxID=29507 RepID=A0A828XSX8_9LEPT|nr:PF07377 family protein [Leptospira kirschneri str. 200802841]
MDESLFMNLSNQEKIDILRISKKIFICIVRHTGKDLDKLSLKTCIVNDLGISGDDVDDLLQDINRYFQVDWSSLNFKEYFGGEGFSIVGFFIFLVRLIFNLMKTISRVLINFNFSHFRFFENNQKDFQIENLILAVYYGKWDNTLISYSIPIEKEIQNWQIQYWNRFKKRC